MDQTQMDIIELLAQHEEALARLYEAYVDALPERRDLWTTMAADEAAHSRWIRDLASAVSEGSLAVGPGRYSLQSLRSSLEFVNGQVTHALSGGVSAVEALSVARDLESALIERNFYDVVEADSADVKRVWRALAESTQAHRARIAEAWERERTAEFSLA
jgi:hypothetical protein